MLHVTPTMKLARYHIGFKMEVKPRIIYKYWMAEVWVHWLVVGKPAVVILVVRECIWNALVVLLDLQTFDDTGSLGYPSRRAVYRSSVFIIVTDSRFLEGNMET